MSRANVEELGAVLDELANALQSALALSAMVRRQMKTLATLVHTATLAQYLEIVSGRLIRRFATTSDLSTGWMRIGPPRELAGVHGQLMP